MGRHVLLVEGGGDQDFFKAYCELVDIANVEVISPKNLDASTANGWTNLVKNLPLLLGEIKAGDVDRLGIILDADYPPHNKGGFAQRFKVVTDKLTEFGYIIPNKPSDNMGDIFSHSDGLPSVGLWIMPDHQSNGMLEGFVESLISTPDQLGLLHHAEQSINSLPTTLFNKALHLTKAKVFTWRAWQNPPGAPLSRVLKDGTLDRSKSAHFDGWLKKVFV